MWVPSMTIFCAEQRRNKLTKQEIPTQNGWSVFLTHFIIAFTTLAKLTKKKKTAYTRLERFNVVVT